MNSVLAIVHIIPGDRIHKEKPAGDLKPEIKPEVKAEGEGEGEQAEGEEVKMEDGEKEEGHVEEDEEDDEVPYIEDVGTREVAGFIVM
jgi:polyribonucleotide 5'-hydroxyl-kinase